MPTSRREFGTPMHLHDRFYAGVFVGFLQDLKSLGETDIGPHGEAIGTALDRVCNTYRNLGGNSFLREQLLPELQAFRQFYQEWNDAYQLSPSEVHDFRVERIFFMRKAKDRIRDLINRHQDIFAAELDSKFTTSLFESVASLRNLTEHLPELCKFLRRAEFRFLPGGGSAKLQSASAPKALDPLHEFRLCVRKLCGVTFEKVHAAAIDDWSRNNLRSLSQQALQLFQANFMKEFQVGLEHRRPRIDQLQDLLDRCSALLRNQKLK